MRSFLFKTELAVSSKIIRFSFFFKEGAATGIFMEYFL
jgi:hypothetical protein